MRSFILRISAFGVSLLGALGCGDEGEGGAGTLRIQLAAEASILAPISVGPGPEQMRDCAVSYSKFLVALGRVELASSRASERRRDERMFVADMKQVGEQGLELVQLTGLAAGQWDGFGFETPAAASTAQALGAVSPGDLAEMIEKGLTYWVEGSAACPERTVSFSFQVAVPTLFYACESDGEPGVAVSGGATSTATITLHGDHLWFDSLPSASEGSVMRRAAWLLQVDADGDGKVSTADLANVRAEAAFPSSLGYNLSGATIGSALDFVRAQLATQGHLNGEGECQWRAP